MGKLIAVKAKETGLKVPREDNTRRYIGDEPVMVEQTNYYIRRVRDGELELLDEAATKALAAKIEAAAKAEAEDEKKASDAAAGGKSAATTTKGKE